MADRECPLIIVASGPFVARQLRRLVGVISCLEVCFTQRVNQPMPRSEAVRDVRE